ncbi:hypothetical protein RhiirB3_457551 [Rhizophagus irregularis]|nr:hypothetical protein RhiirB3_457551 [Rhizophagus irregularis]
MWNPSDDENLKILSQSLKVKAFVNQLSKRSVLMKIEVEVLSARHEELKKYIQPDIHVTF